MAVAAVVVAVAAVVVVVDTDKRKGKDRRFSYLKSFKNYVQGGENNLKEKGHWYFICLLCAQK